MSLIALYIFFILATVPLARPYPLSTQPTPDATAPEIATTTHEEIPRCPAGPGNGDLYGLGIRLGIYLQWLASHITHTVSPASAAATHDANSVFLLAILIALTTGTARRRKWIRAEEAYIVLLVAWGFVGTVVGVAGVRLRGLEGRSVCGWAWVKKRLRGWIGKRRARGKSKEKTKGSPHGEGRLASFRRWTRAMTLSEMKTHSLRRRKRVLRLTLGAASVVKHPSFSWAGVFWRSSILSYLAALNAWVWWSGVEEWQLSRARGAGGKAFAQAPTWASDGCVHVVFFFGAHALEQGALMRVLRVLSLVLAVPALVFSVAIALVAAVLLRFVVQTEGDDFITSLSLRNTEDTPTRRHLFSWIHLLRRLTKSASSKPVKTQAHSKPKSKSEQRSAPPRTEIDNDNVPKPLRRVRRSSSLSLAAASSAVGKPFLLGVRDVVTQWFVRKEAEQLRMGREREDEDDQRQQRGEEERGQDLAVVWKPFMTLMMNRGEGEGEVKGEENNSSASHAATTSASSNHNHRHCKHSTKLKPEPRHHHHHHHHPDPLPHHHIIHFLPQILHILPLAAFIISIEASLRLARLTAVNDLSSIGQLIPFIIGLASFAASLREVLLVVQTWY
ncbi:hypothetical protein IWX47DRAFT_912274 [Phyllosticta citricarpa]